MKIVHGSIALLFILFAVVQYNDPDPWIWITYYVFTGLASAMAATGRYHTIMIVGGLAISIIWLLSLVPGVIDWIQQGMPSITGAMHAETEYIELMREFLGVLLVLLNFIFLYFQMRKVRS